MEAPTPNVTVFGDGTFMEAKLNEVIKSGALIQ